MSYNGTLTITDPDLVTRFDDLPGGVSTYVVRDTDAEAPDWDGIGYVYALAYDGTRWASRVVHGDGSDPDPLDVGVVSEAWHRLRDSELTGRYLRAFHGAVSVDYSESIDRNARIYAVVTRAQAEAWGCSAEDWPKLAGQALDLYRQWAEGDVYGVIAVNPDTGEEASCFGVYDSSVSLTYCQTVAVELAEEVSA